MKREDNVHDNQGAVLILYILEVRSMDGQVASPEQVDLLGFWEVEHKLRIKSRFMY